MGRTRRGRVLLGSSVAVLCAVLTGCNGIPAEPFVEAQAADRTPSAPPALTATAVQAEFAQFAAQHPGEVSLAWVPVGSTQVQSLGQTRDSDAWSTIKVPISVAALSKAAGDEDASQTRREQVREAIEWSDNEAAARLYRSLGGETAAEEAVEAVLRASGDQRTEVNQDADGRANGFGRTVWRVDDSATFASHLPCRAEDAFVYDEMGRISEDHRWGLGSLTTPVHFKGGWGPSDHGYLVRQLGTVDHHGGRTAVAFVVVPEDGKHETAAATASALATWLSARLGPADAGSCQAAPVGD